jgi:hypothetical protein
MGDRVSVQSMQNTQDKQGVRRDPFDDSAAWQRTAMKLAQDCT